MCVVGAGQSGLALGFHLQRLARRRKQAGGPPTSFVLLDDGAEPGGAWVHGWDTLCLFSPAAYSSLAGWPMPPWPHEGTPSAAHVASYLRDYEARYALPVHRPRRVVAVTEAGGAGRGRLEVLTEDGSRWWARVVVNATGSWSRPFWPSVPGRDFFGGVQVHTVGYRSAATLPGRRVLVVGGGNSGAQIAADLLLHSAREVVWATRTPPRLLPDDVDGRVLFATATRAVRERDAGRTSAGVASLGDIVVTPGVREARDERGLRAVGMPDRLTATGAVWADGTTRLVDTIVWCTGFRPALRHLHPLGLSTRRGHPVTRSPAPGSTAAVAVDDPRVFFLGYGDWCALASATLIGVNRSARDTAAAVADRVDRVEVLAESGQS